MYTNVHIRAVLLRAALATLCLVGCGRGSLQAQVNFFTKVKKAPCYKLDDYGHLVLTKPNKKLATPWVVYAAADKVPTYASPIADKQLARLSLLQPCYVIGKKGDYMQLVAYSDKALKKTPGLVATIIGKKKYFRFADPKQVTYLGWVNQKYLILRKNALMTSEGRFLHYQVGISSMQALDSLPKRMEKGKIALFGEPELKNKAKEQAVEFGDLLAVLREDASLNATLVSSSHYLSPDSLPTKFGWMPNDLLRHWSDGLLMKSIRPDTCYEQNIARLYPDSPFGKKTMLVRTELIDSLGNADTLETLRDIRRRLLLEPENLDKGGKFKGFPLKGGMRPNWNPQQDSLRTSYSFDLIDRSKNKVVNVDGDVIMYKEYLETLENLKHTNIVLLVEESTEAMQHLKLLSNILQGLWASLREHTDTKYRYGLVSFGYRTSSFVQEPQPRFASWLSYISEQVAGSKVDATQQPDLLYGLGKVATMLKPQQDHNNLVIVVGSKASMTDSLQVYLSKMEQATKGLGDQKTRLVFYQTTAENNDAYTNFVLIAKKILYTASEYAEKKKRRHLLTYKRLPRQREFAQLGEEQNAYYLDFPARSTHQGGVIFPSLGKRNQPVQLQQMLDTVIQQMRLEKELLVQEFDTAFALVGALNNSLNPDLAYLASDFPKQILREKDLVYMPMSLPFYFNPKDSVGHFCENFQPHLMLTRQELDALHNMFDLLDFPTLNNGEFKSERQYRKKIRKRLLKIANQKLAAQGLKNKFKKKDILSKVISYCFDGIPLSLPNSFQQKTRKLTSKSKIPLIDIYKYRLYINGSAMKIKDVYDPGSQFVSGTNTYYLLPKTVF